MEESKFLEGSREENRANWQDWFDNHGTTLALCAAMLFLTIISFNLGRLSAQKRIRPPISVINNTNQKEANLNSLAKTSKPSKNYDTEPVAASKKSSGKLYHFGWCSGYSKISAQNRLTFPNETAAIAAGYTLAGNCQKQ